LFGKAVVSLVVFFVFFFALLDFTLLDFIKDDLMSVVE